jgi:hypothetical protein
MYLHPNLHPVLLISTGIGEHDVGKWNGSAFAKYMNAVAILLPAKTRSLIREGI